VAWKVKYEAGPIEARGYRGAQQVLRSRRETTGAPAALALRPDRIRISAGAEDVSMAAVEVVDAQGRIVPTADHDITFAVTLFPHWNWSGKEGPEIEVWAHSNLDRVELFLNGRSLGSQDVPRNSHVAWKVKYEPGPIEARGYKGAQQVLTSRRETTGAPAALALRPDRIRISAKWWMRRGALCQRQITTSRSR
jgi:hypothetical protein